MTNDEALNLAGLLSPAHLRASCVNLLLVASELALSKA
jgi:hypothetical protein